MYKVIAIISLVITLSAVNWSIANKEKHLSDGKTIYLELAPQDPRSLIQGDYMALQFIIANDLRRDLAVSSKKPDSSSSTGNSDGIVIVALDKHGVAKYSRIDNDEILADNEIKIQFRLRGNKIKFATNAFFFQEGKASIYQPARYGQFKVDKEGELLLTAMYDKELKELGL